MSLQVPLDASVLNDKDSWILDGGKGNTIYLRSSPSAKPMQKLKAVQHANSIRDDEHAGNAEVEIIGKCTFQR